MFDLWRRDKKRPGQRTPLGKAGRIAESDHMRLNTGPADHQPVLRRVFNYPFQPHCVATFGSAEMGSGLSDSGFKSGCAGGIDGDIRDFCDHAGVMAIWMAGDKC